MLPPEPLGSADAGSSSPAEWRWECLDAAGALVAVPAEFRLTFPSQADAESWLGECWSELAEVGVDQVTLKELDRTVYGPMSLHA